MSRLHEYDEDQFARDVPYTMAPPTLVSSRAPDAVRNPRQFDTGATRDTDADKLDFEGFLSPIVLHRFAQYMHKNRLLLDGSLRDSDNWQNGIPRAAYAKSLLRHLMDLWLLHRGYAAREDVEEALCGIMFNSMGYLFELLEGR